MYKLYNDLQLKIVENQNLYRNDFRFNEEKPRKEVIHFVKNIFS